MRSQNSKTKSGFSILAVLAISMILGTLIFYVLRQNTVNNKKTLMLKIERDSDILTNQIFGHLVDKHKCTLSFEAGLLPNRIVSEVEIIPPVDASTPATVTALAHEFETDATSAERYGNAQISIASYELIETGPTNPYAELNIFFRNRNTIAKELYRRSIDVYVEWEGVPFGSNVTMCQAVTDLDQIWTVGPVSSAFYVGDDDFGGKVGVGRGEVPARIAGDTSPLTKEFEVEGTARVSRDLTNLETESGRVTAVQVLYPSDERLKKNSRAVSDPLSKLKSMQGVSFEWKASGAKDFGFIAQDLREVLPELVNEDSLGRHSIDYGKISAVLVEALRQQRGQINELNARLQELKAKN